MKSTVTHPHVARWTAIFGPWVALAILVFGVHSLVAKPFYIPSESMMPTLRVGDRLLVSRYPYGWSYASASFHVLPFMHGRLFGRTPARGDVVIIARKDTKGRSEDLIKRIIGVPGDSVQMVGGRLWLNGKPVAVRPLGNRLVPTGANDLCQANGSAAHPVVSRDGRSFCPVPAFRETLPGGRAYETLDLGSTRVDDTIAYHIPAGHIFLMGDNRDNSADSRVPAERGGLGGPVPLESVGGRAEFITFSTAGRATWNPLTWFSGFTTERSGVSLRP